MPVLVHPDPLHDDADIPQRSSSGDISVLHIIVPSHLKDNFSVNFYHACVYSTYLKTVYLTAEIALKSHRS